MYIGKKNLFIFLKVILCFIFYNPPNLRQPPLNVLNKLCDNCC